MNNQIDDSFGGITDRLSDNLSRRSLLGKVLTSTGAVCGAFFLSGFRPPVPTEIEVSGNGCTHKKDSCDADGDHCGMNGSSCKGYGTATGCLDAATGCPRGSVRSSLWAACCLCVGKANGYLFKFWDCCTAPGGTLNAACSGAAPGSPSCNNSQKCPGYWCVGTTTDYICTISEKTNTPCP
jgi:hypothetical protein